MDHKLRTNTYGHWEVLLGLAKKVVDPWPPPGYTRCRGMERDRGGRDTSWAMAHASDT